MHQCHGQTDIILWQYPPMLTHIAGNDTYRMKHYAESKLHIYNWKLNTPTTHIIHNMNGNVLYTERWLWTCQNTVDELCHDQECLPDEDSFSV